MKVGKLLPIILLFFLIVAPSAAANAKEEVITIWVQAEIGINVSVNCGGSDSNVLVTKVGEPGDCLLTVRNTGNIEDIIRLEAPIATGSPETDRSWIDYHFECPGTIGECSLEYSYESSLQSGEWPEVRNIRLTPDINETHLYLEATPYKIGDPVTSIKIYGYSLTNRTKDSFQTIPINSESKEKQYGPFVATGLQNTSLLILFLLSGIVFWATKFR